MSEHTEGPWRIASWESDGDCIVAPSGRRGHICEVRNQVVTGSVEANARLIAAAPELLEALKSIENDCGCIPDHLWELRSKAIAKAEGRDE